MNEQKVSNAALMRQLPSVDVVLQQAHDLVEQYGHPSVTEQIRNSLAVIRENILSGQHTFDSVDAIISEVRDSARGKLAQNSKQSLTPVFNLTGTILHTNLGRAILPDSALQAVVTAAANPVNLEYDLEKGGRGERDSHIEGLICELTGAEAATAVNNNAAAVLLVLNSLARGREVPVSRGELVEIGGSFRVPEVMERSGCKLVEIGATNRTHVKDYKKAINENTALLMKVHTSNYRIEGFTAAVDETQLAALAHEHKLPFIIDMGSGCLVDLARFGLPAEPTAAQALAAGADIVTFSGDKLLGGPQCGIIAGRKDLVQAIRHNPLKRALRLDKMTLAALAEVLQLYRNPDALVKTLPTLRQFTRPISELVSLAEGLLPVIRKSLPSGFSVVIEESSCQVGSGALPVEGINSVALVIKPDNGKDEAIRQLAVALRQLPTPVLGRISKGSLVLDLRCLEKEKEFTEQLKYLHE